jgi:hypothetical protein
MRFSATRLRRGEVIAGVGGVALLVFLFALNWLSFGGVNRHGWTAVPVLRWLLLIVAAAAIALALTQALYRAPAIPVSLSAIVTVLGSVAVVCFVVKLLTTSAGLCIGIFLGLVATIAITIGAFQSLRREQGWTPGPDRPIETVSLHSPHHG